MFLDVLFVGNFQKQNKLASEYSNGDTSAVRVDFKFYMSSFEFYWVKMFVWEFELVGILSSSHRLACTYDYHSFDSQRL